MRIVFLLALVSLLILGAQDSSFAQKPKLVLKEAQREYKTLNDIKAILVNESDKSIYLLPEDCGEACVWLFYMNKTWSQSMSSGCVESDTSIEIKSGESYKIPSLVWRPLRTYEGKLIERKNFPGKYKIEMRYSLTLIKRLGKPQLRQRVSVTSEEFIIVQ
jgi:hypothetical protein